MIDRSTTRWPMAMIASGLALAVFALARHLWHVLPWERFALSLLLGVLALVLAWPLRRLARWSWASALLLVWSLALLYFVGPFAVAAVLLLAAAAMVLGLRLATQGPGQGPLAVVLGLVLVAGASGWIVALPVHHPLAWGGVLLLIVLAQHARLRHGVQVLQAGWRQSVTATPTWAAFAVLLLGLATTGSWLPTMQVDDLAYHLGLPSQWLAQSSYVPDPAHQVWAFAPWAGDALHGIVAVLSRGAGRGAMNALWIVLAAAAVWAACARLSATTSERWACVALFASFPPLVWLAAGMQTELPAMAVLVALAALLLPAPLAGDGRRSYAAAVLLGGLFALKPVHAFAALPLLAYAGWQYRGHWPWRRLPLLLLVVLLVGGSSYWSAWQSTGNPVLPLFNGIFGSPYYPLRDFDDLRWHAGIGPLLPWQLVVDTDRYLEAWDGGIGLSLVALAGAWGVAVLRAETRAFALAAALTVALPLLPLQYARYAFPGMVLLLVALLPRREADLGPRCFAAAVVVLCLANLAFQANSGWTHHSSALKHTLRSGGDTAAVLLHYVPERVLLARIPADASVVLATDPTRPYIAEMAGRGRTLSSHDPTLEAARIAAEADPSGARWQALFAASRARWILLTPASASVALRRGLAAAAATRSARAGDAELWQLPVAAEPTP